jgi:hypothetical protein
MSPLQRKAKPIGGDQGGYDIGVLENLEEDLTRMTNSISVTNLHDILSCMQIVGAQSRFSRLLKRVDRAIVCYIDHHHDD